MVGKIFYLLIASFLLQIESSLFKGSLVITKNAIEKIDTVLRFAEEKRPYSPSTIRLATFSNDDVEFISPVEPFWKNPIIRSESNKIGWLKPQQRKKSNNVKLFTFITIFVILHPEDLETLALVIKNSIDPRRDFVIFVCSPEIAPDLRKLYGLREKIIIEIDSPGIWVEPIHHNGDMILLDKIEDIQIANPMGANLRGRHLRASAPETPPYNFKAGEDKNGNAIIDGCLCRIFRATAVKYNFSYFIGYEGYDYGTLHPNGTWSGSYSKIHYPDSGYDMDLIVSPELLWNQLDAASVATYIDMIFGVAHPEAKQHWYAFILPFYPEVWTWTFITFVFIGIVQGIAMFFMQGRKLKPIVFESTSLLPFAIAMEQGLQEIPKGIRYFSLILLFGCTVLGTGYKSTLRTHLMFPKPDPVPTTFQELADRVDYKPTVTVLGALEKHFWETSEVQAVRKIRERMQFSNNWEKCYKDAFLDKKAACISWVQGIYIVARTLTLNTTVEPMLFSKDAAIRKFLSLGFQENSIYVDSFNSITGTMAAMGIVMKWETDILNSFKKSGRKSMLNQSDTDVFAELIRLATPQEDQVPLKFGSLFVVIGFIPAGVLLGAIAFSWERYCGRRKTVHKSQTTSPNSSSQTTNVETSNNNASNDIDAILSADNFQLENNRIIRVISIEEA